MRSVNEERLLYLWEHNLDTLLSIFRRVAMQCEGPVLMSCGMWPEINTLLGAFIRLLGPPLIVIPVRLELGPER